MMRWDQAGKATAWALATTLLLSAAPIFSDGKVTGAELVMLVGTFCASAGLYMKDHPPVTPPVPPQ